MVEDYQKEAVEIPDICKLIRQLLIDDLRNHKLKHLVPHEKIIPNFEGTFEELPCILIQHVGETNMLKEEAIPGGTGSTWTSAVEITIICTDDAYCNYPPHEPGELDDGSTRFDGAEKVLNTIYWILYRTLSENRRGYEADFLDTYQWDDIRPVGFEMIPGGYNGERDLWALILAWEFDQEIVSRSDC